MVTGSADCFVAQRRLAKRLHSDECEAIHKRLDQAEELLLNLADTFAAADTPHDNSNCMDILRTRLPAGIPCTPGH